MDIFKLGRSRRGQNTVEYLLMLSVIVGVVLISGLAMKKFMPGLFQGIAEKIMHATEELGS
jgi:hypothetical protein